MSFSAYLEALCSVLKGAIKKITPPILPLIELIDESREAFTDLHSFVEDAAADLNHLQVLLLLIPRTLDVCHPAPLVLLTGVDEVPDRAILVEHLGGGGDGGTTS